MSSGIYKGFTRSHLERAFSVRFTQDGVEVPYYGINGEPYREKLFSKEGRPIRWLGEGKPQIPYGLETLAIQDHTAFLTEGESCAWALRAAFPHNPVLGIPGASGWKSEWYRILRLYPVIYLSFDNDSAGMTLLEAVLADLPWARRVVLPEGRDTRDVLQLCGGMDAYERLLDDADYMAGLRKRFLDVVAQNKRKDSLHVAA